MMVKHLSFDGDIGTEIARSPAIHCISHNVGRTFVLAEHHCEISYRRKRDLRLSTITLNALKWLVVKLYNLKSIGSTVSTHARQYNGCFHIFGSLPCVSLKASKVWNHSSGNLLVHPRSRRCSFVCLDCRIKVMCMPARK